MDSNFMTTVKATSGEGAVFVVKIGNPEELASAYPVTALPTASEDYRNLVLRLTTNNALYVLNAAGDGWETPHLVDPTRWEDVNLDLGPLRSGGTAPGLVNYRNTGIYLLGFDVNDEVSGTLEIPHGVKLESAFWPHIHFYPETAPTGTDYVKFNLAYVLKETGDEFPASAGTLTTGDVAIGTQYVQQFAEFTSSITNLDHIGGQLSFTLSRVAASGDAYAGECIMATIGFHVQFDGIGSTTRAEK